MGPVILFVFAANRSKEGSMRLIGDPGRIRVRGEYPSIEIMMRLHYVTLSAFLRTPKRRP